MKKVKILLSAYNGEKYIEEQLESLYHQTYPNIEILVRDDGSKDRTLKILKSHQQCGKLRCIEGSNVGYWNSFFALLEDSSEADYYAFCDQDDVWLPNKIATAITELDKINENEKAMFFGGFDYYDANMEWIGKGPQYQKKITFANALFECLPLGCNTIINRDLRNCLIQNKPSQCKSHDWWTFMVATGFGATLYKEEALMKYRRHDHNVSPTGNHFFQLLKFRIKTFFMEDYFRVIRNQIKEYESFFVDQLCIEDQKLLKKLVYPTWGKRISLVFYPHHYRQKLVDDLVIRVLIAFGKL